eukprot:TRINITY_DN10865_c0_g1_i1.p1 TRINITY_DN10865_c0_g1~~TRINITY_DN10865_c0_g1_i1.p1  ORF type:complete len:127 (-),score=12.32 TRINITY_DN10865_c0_g1_i1:296-676(-)
MSNREEGTLGLKSKVEKNGEWIVRRSEIIGLRYKDVKYPLKCFVLFWNNGEETIGRILSFFEASAEKKRMKVQIFDKSDYFRHYLDSQTYSTMESEKELVATDLVKEYSIRQLINICQVLVEHSRK